MIRLRTAKTHMRHRRVVRVPEQYGISLQLLALFGFDACCLDDRRPARDLACDQGSKRLRAALRFSRNVAAEVEQAIMYVLVLERSVERIGEYVEGRLRCPLGRKQGVPG